MFAVHDRSSSRQTRGDNGFDRRPVARMHDVRPVAPDGPYQCRSLKTRPRSWSGEGQDLDAIHWQALKIWPETAQSADDMLEPVRIHRLDQIHQAVLEAPLTEVVDDVHDP